MTLNLFNFAGMTPAQQVRLKIYIHIFLIAACNGVLSVMAYLDNNTMVTWQEIAWILAGQILLSILDNVSHYYTATNQTAKAALASAVRVEAATKTSYPAVVLTPQERAVQQAVNTILDPSALYSSVPTEQGGKGEETSAPAAAPVQPDMSNVQTVNTLPDLAAVRAAAPKIITASTTA